jgi:hypothetical protein
MLMVWSYQRREKEKEEEEEGSYRYFSRKGIRKPRIDHWDNV